MVTKKTKRKYQLFITDNSVSKSKRFYHIFKPKDIVVGEVCEITFTIKNIGKEVFPGGQLTHLKIGHIETKEHTKYYGNEMEIPKISPNKSYTTEVLKYIPINSGNTWFTMLIIPSNNEKIEYYQLEKATNKKASLSDLEVWRDYFYVASKQEIHQRYTNYLLLILTSLTIFLFVINLGLLLR